MWEHVTAASWGRFRGQSRLTDRVLTNGEGEGRDQWEGDRRLQSPAVARGRTQGCPVSATVLAGPAPGSLTSSLLFTPATFTPASGPGLLRKRPSSELWVATAVTSPTGWPWPSHLCTHPF